MPSRAAPNALSRAVPNAPIAPARKVEAGRRVVVNNNPISASGESATETGEIATATEVVTANRIKAVTAIRSGNVRRGLNPI